MSPRLIPRKWVYALRSEEERAAFEWWLGRRSPQWSVALHMTRRCGDDRDADLMLGLTGTPCDAHGICNAALFQAGCVIYNTTAQMRFAIRAYPGQHWNPDDAIVYFG